MMLLVAFVLMGAGTAWGAEVTIASFTASTYNSGTTNGWTISNANYATASNGYYQLTYSNASIVTPEIDWSLYEDITITISARKYGGPDATQGKISVSQGETELTSYSPSGTSIVASSALSITPSTGALTISCPGASGNKGCGVQSIVIKGTEVSTATLVSIALSGDYPTTFSEGDAFSHEGMVVTATYDDQTTKDVTSKATFTGYDMSATGNQTITVSYTEGEVTKTAEYTITVNAIPTHTVTWSVNGTTTTDTFKEGASITFPANLADIEGKSFVGWVADAISGVTDEAPTFVTSATMGTVDVTYYAVFADKTAGTAANVTDDLTYEVTGVTSQSYSSFTGKSATGGSVAVYAGQCSGGGVGTLIQLRTNNSNSGIVSTTSGGIIKKVTVEWTNGNTSGRKLDIYGKNTAYSDATDLYDSSNQGTLLGSITYGTSTELTVTDSYSYVGLRSNDGSIYFDKISIVWEAGTPDTYSGYCTTVAADTRVNPELSFSETEVNAAIGAAFNPPTLNTATGFNGTVVYSSSNESVAQIMDIDTGEIRLVAEGTTTITATFAGNDDFKAGSASYTLIVTDSRIATTITQDDIVLDISEVETLTQLAPVVKDANDNVVAYDNTGGLPEVYFNLESDDNLIIGSLDGNGVIMLNSVAGTATIKAYYNMFNENATYKPSNCTFTITVEDPNAPGHVNNPYTVAQAIDATPTSGQSDFVYIKGIVSSFFNTSIVGDGSNYRYYISDDGTTTTQLLVYKGKGLNEATFSNADDLKVGDEVVVYGKLTIYQNAPEVVAGNYLVSWNRPVVASITVDPTTVNVDAGDNYGTLDLDYENLTITDMTDFDVVYYDENGDDSTEPDWIEVLVAEQDPSIGQGYVVSYAVEANTGAERTAYFKIYALDDQANDVYSELITMTQAAYVAPAVTIGNFEKVTSTDDITTGQYLIVYEDGAVAFDGSLETLDAVGNVIDVTIENDKIAATTENAKSVFNIDVTAGTLQSASGLYIGVSSNSNGMKTSEDADAYTHTFSIDEGYNAVIAAVFEGSTMTMRFNSASNQNRFRYYKSGQQPVQLYKFVPDAADASVNVTAAGYATYCSDKDLNFAGTGLTAYKATVANNEVSFEEVKHVPAGQGVLLKGAEGTYNVPVAAYAAALTGNAFIGVNAQTTVNETGIFVLMNGTKGVGFYKTTTVFTVGAHTAYLPADVAAGRSFIGFDGETTGINNVNVNENENRVFDLQGRRVAQPTKGMYIVNGRKVIVK